MSMSMQGGKAEGWGKEDPTCPSQAGTWVGASKTSKTSMMTCEWKHGGVSSRDPIYALAASCSSWKKGWSKIQRRRGFFQNNIIALTISFRAQGAGFVSESCMGIC